MTGLPELDFELTTFSNPSNFSRGIPPYREEEEEGSSLSISGCAHAKAAKHAKAEVTPAVCGRCGGALAPFLLVAGGREALLCLRCKRWTYPDKTSDHEGAS